jgi:hypothetical protein
MLVSEAQTALMRFGFDSTDPLTIWLNEAMHQFEDAHDWGFLQQIATVNTVVGDSTLTLPTTLHKIQSIRDVTSKKKLGYVTISEFERVVIDPTTRGQPDVYTITNMKVVQFYPATDLARTFRVVYQEELVDMAATNVSMPGPTRIHYPIVQGAAMIALQAENEEDRAISAKAEFEAAIDRLWTKYNSKELDEPQQVTDVMGYGS